MAELERISITIDADLLEQLDAFIARAGHGNRSEVIRDMIRDRLIEDQDGDTPGVGAVTITYDHHRRDLAERLVGAAHEHHDLVLSTLHVHLDHDHCLEVSALRGARRDMRAYADHLLSMRGVIHGGLVMTSEVI